MKIQKILVIQLLGLWNSMAFAQPLDIVLKPRPYRVEATLNTEAATLALAGLMSYAVPFSGVTKLEIYNQLVNVPKNGAFTIEIDASIPLTDSELQRIAEDARKSLVDRFLAYFETRGDLDAPTPVLLETFDSEALPTDVNAQCWTLTAVDEGELSCHDFIYPLPQWKYGLNFEQIKERLTVKDLVITELK